VGLLVDDVEEILYVDEQDCAYAEDADSLIQATVTLEGGKRVILWLRLEKVLAGIRFRLHG
jgi:chemotaxis signal transduction protein